MLSQPEISGGSREIVFQELDHTIIRVVADLDPPEPRVALSNPMPIHNTADPIPARIRIAAW